MDDSDVVVGESGDGIGAGGDVSVVCGNCSRFCCGSLGLGCNGRSGV
jgi:hypothetical protein